MRAITRLIAPLAVLGVLSIANPGAAADHSVLYTSGYVTRHASINVAAGHTGWRTVQCPDGYLLVSGGAYWTDPGQALDPSLAASASFSASLPTQSGRAWYAAGRAARALTLNVTAHCLPKARIGAYNINVTDFPEAAVSLGTVAGGYVSCPVGQRIVAGGVGWRRVGDPFVPSTANEHFLTSSSPTIQANGWYAAGHAFVEDGMVLHAVAMCRPASAVGTYRITTITGGPSHSLAAGGYLRCPRKTHVVPAGAYWHVHGRDPDPTLANEVNLGALSPTLDKLGMYAAGQVLNTTHTWELTLLAECRPVSPPRR
jgi:hypothetical protein